MEIVADVEIIFMYPGQSIVYIFFHVVFELCMNFLVQPGSLPGVVGSSHQIIHFSRSPAPIVCRDKAYCPPFVVNFSICTISVFDLATVVKSLYSM